MPYGTLNAGTITPGSGNTLTINESVDGTAIKDEDAMGSNSATHLATQQSIKSYTDALKTNSSITTLGTVTAGNISNTAIVFPTGHIIQTKISNTASFVTTETDFAGNAITVRGSFTMACTAGNTLVTQLCVGGYNVALTGNEDVWYGKLGIGVSDPGSTNGNGYSYLGNNSGTGTVKYYTSNGQASERTHGLSWTNVLQPTVTGTYYLFFLAYRGGASGNLTIGLNTSTQYIAQEFQGDCLV